MKRAVKFQLHIDHIDNPDGDVWAVRYGKTYKTAHSVRMVGTLDLTCNQVRAKQPRAFVSGTGEVFEFTRKGKRTIVIRGGLW